MRTNAEQFATLGFPWDDRVNPAHGLTRELPRGVVRTHPDGFTQVEVNKDWSSFEELEDSPRWVQPPAPVEKPDRARAEASREARRHFNRYHAGRTARIKL